MKARRGQVALYLVMVLVVLLVLTLGNASAFLAVRAKNHTMNAGDAAALAAAREQANLLNRIGHLNIEHAEADYAGNYARSLEIVREQRRLAFLGPLECLRAANRAARENGALDDPEMAAVLSEHVSDIRGKYVNYPELYPEPWEGAWLEYAAELSSVISEGIAAGADNIDFLDVVECFPLTDKSFYSMVNGKSWCKLVVAGWQDLLNCDSHNMPRPNVLSWSSVVNSEICSLHLRVSPLLLDGRELDELRAVLALNGATFPPEQKSVDDNRPLDDPSRCYFFYARDGVWLDGEGNRRTWLEMDPSSAFRFPLVSKVKAEFDVLGCTSVFRVTEKIPRLLSGDARLSAWSAAAKPFGTIQTSRGASVVTDDEAHELVLPAYEAVRLIPLGAANAGGKDLSTADAAWLSHVRDHVPQYLADGVGGLPCGCAYCQALIQWEDASFRAGVSTWIRENGDTCVRSGGPGPSMQGGTAYAH